MPIAKISDEDGLAGKPLTPGCPALPAPLRKSKASLRGADGGHPHQALLTGPKG